MVGWRNVREVGRRRFTSDNQLENTGDQGPVLFVDIVIDGVQKSLPAA